MTLAYDVVKWHNIGSDQSQTFVFGIESDHTFNFLCGETSLLVCWLLEVPGSGLEILA